MDGGVEDAPAPDNGPRPVKLPEDERPHADPVEWWYYTGLLETKDGKKYGFEMVTFQAMMVGFPTYIAHFGVTDLAKGSFSLATQPSSGKQPQPAEGFALDVGGFKTSGHLGKHRIEATIEGEAAEPAYGIDLELDSTKPVVMQYGKGWMTIGSDDPFYYYSYTNMKISGTLTVDGKPTPVTGRAWMDHQWGNMGNLYDGWQWFSVRLDDGSEVMMFQVDRAEPFRGGTLIEADGTYAELKPADFSTTATGEWTSPHTGGTYPHGWTASLPGRKLELTIKPLVADQEFYLTSFEPVYWEGLCEVSGTRDGSPVTGHAYVELTGYVDSGDHP